MNECDEKEEYRCMNGMCIPAEYFLDGERDCLDWSDEMQFKNGEECATERVSLECDDRLCPPNQWSCGDGQCIRDRLAFQYLTDYATCQNRRDQSFICETHYHLLSWTMPNGRCHEGGQYKGSPMLSNVSEEEKCLYLLRCSLSRGGEAGCPCFLNYSCTASLYRHCSMKWLDYPDGALITSYMFFTFRIDPVVSIETSLVPRIWINGKIQCRDSLISHTDIVLQRWNQDAGRVVHDMVCRKRFSVPPVKEDFIDVHECHRPNESTSICDEWNRCLSHTRMKDGFSNCLNSKDEINQTQMDIEKSCSGVRRHRFRCSTEQPTCLSVMALGNGKLDCENRFDEFWFGSTRKLSQMKCNQQRRDECLRLRQYIEQQSGNSINMEQRFPKFVLPFRFYCDTFWDLHDAEDENINECRQSWACAADQERCPTGHCIDRAWNTDHEWDCPDAHDERKIFHQIVQVAKQRAASLSLSTNESFFLSNTCHQTDAFLCLVPQISQLQFHCIDRSQIGDGKIDCAGAIDERSTMKHCNQSSMLGYHFKCASSNTCIPYSLHCQQGFRCPNRTDDHSWCSRHSTSSTCQNANDFICLDGTCQPEGRCNKRFSCPLSEDEYMCDYPSSSTLKIISYREEKELRTSTKRKDFIFPRFPLDVEIFNESMLTTNITGPLTPNNSSFNHSSFAAFSCNRGIGILSGNNSIICFCSPQYFREKCQYHNDRLSLLLHLNLSRSLYSSQSDPNITLKLLVLFLSDNQTLITHEFHLRPALEITTLEQKMMVDLPYSHSSMFRRQRRERYFNRSEILAHHPYSIQIELYELVRLKSPSLIAVWKYPIFFDYLPVFRFARVLHLTKVNKNRSRCSNDSCCSNEECRPLMNNKSEEIIYLCKANFTGENCEIEDERCLSGFCALGSVCKPNYRRLLRGNGFPYCICRSGQFGARCDIEVDLCQPNPCQNGGSCFPSARLDQLVCRCSKEYYGNKCELKKLYIRLTVEANLQYVGVVVQFFDLDFITLDLHLVDQQVYKHLPRTIEYYRNEQTVPTIVLGKVYSSYEDSSPDLYLLSLFVSAKSIDGQTVMSEINRCSHVSTLIENSSPIRYHRLCMNQSSLLCFRDDVYLCICVDNHTRVDCFRYEPELDLCSFCLSGGRCLRGDPTRSNDFICLCPSCYSGRQCQFSSTSFTFSLDQLFYTDLTSARKQATIAVLIAFPLLGFFFALPNNIFSFVTLRRRPCLRNGIGHYLFCLSVINQITLALLTIRLIHLGLTASAIQSSPNVDHLLCKCFSYFLTCCIRLSYWLASFVSLERVYTAVFLNKQWLKQPRVARRLMSLTFAVVFLSATYELVFIRAFADVDKGHGSMCVIEFPMADRLMWIIIHQLVFVIHLIIPLLINICCACTIITIVIKTKMKLRGQSESSTDANRNRRDVLREVLNENKEMIARPAMTLVPSIFSLFTFPLFVIGFSLGCHNLENNPLRYLLIIFYFITFIPQMVTFLLYIYPSSFFWKQWQATTISKWIATFGRQPISNDSSIFSTIREQPTKGCSNLPKKDG